MKSSRDGSRGFGQGAGKGWVWPLCVCGSDGEGQVTEEGWGVRKGKEVYTGSDHCFNFSHLN